MQGLVENGDRKRKQKNPSFQHSTSIAIIWNCKSALGKQLDEKNIRIVKSELNNRIVINEFISGLWIMEHEWKLTSIIVV